MTEAKPSIIFTSRLDAAQAGGVESAVREISAALAADRPDWNVRCVHAFSRRTRLNSIPFLGDLLAGIIIAGRSRNADAVVINGGEYAWPRVLSRRARAATAVVWHGTRAGEIPALRPRMSLPVRAYRSLEVRLQRFALLARSQIAVSETTRAELRATYGARHAIVLIPNGAPDVVRRDGETSIVEPLPYRVAWLGTTAYKKGLDLAIEACRFARRRHPELRLAVIGLDSSATAGTSASASARTNVGSRAVASSDSGWIARSDSNPSAAGEWIDYLGRLDHAATLHELRRCSIYLGTSRYEGCSVAVIEALSLGMPVVAAPSIAWMIGEAGVEVADYEPNSYASALEALLDVRDVRTSYAERAHAAALAFDWRLAAQAYAREIETCLQRHSPRAGGSR